MVDKFLVRPKGIRPAIARFCHTERHRTDRHEETSSRCSQLFERAYKNLLGKCRSVRDNKLGKISKTGDKIEKLC